MFVMPAPTLPESKHEDFKRDALAGAKDHDLARTFDIYERTAYNWRVRLAPESLWQGESKEAPG